jgi:hypothetical protein
MDSRKKQYEKSLPLDESGAAIASPSVIPPYSGTISGKPVARIALTRETSANTPKILLAKESAEKHTTGQMWTRSESDAKTKRLPSTAQPAIGTILNSQNRAAAAQFAEQPSLMRVVSSCLLTIGTSAAIRVERATNAVAGFFVGAATLLLSGSKLTLSGESRLSPILGGTHE